MKDFTQKFLSFSLCFLILAYTTFATENGTHKALITQTEKHLLDHQIGQKDWFEMKVPFDKESVAGPQGSYIGLKSIIWYKMIASIFIVFIFFILTLNNYSAAPIKSLMATDSVPDFRMDFEFEEGKQTTIASNWIDSAWVPFTKNEGFSSNFQSFDSTITFQFDSISDGWIYASKRVNQFNLEGRDTSSTSFLYDKLTSSWINSNKNLSQYDDIGNRLHIDYFAWNELQSEWIKQSRTEYYYTGNNRDSTYHFSWNTIEEGWDAVSKSTSQYYDDEQTDVTMNYGRNHTEKTWFPSYMGFNAFNDIGVNDTSGGYNWSQQDNEWVASWLTVNNYNGTRMQVSDEYNWDSQEGKYKLDSRGYYYYEDDNTGIDKFEIPNLSIYPNPAQDYVTIKLGSTKKYKLKVYNLNGQRILTKELSGNETKVSVNNFDSGTYLFKVDDGKNSSTRKVVIQ